MLAQGQKNVLEEIFKSWLFSKSNYILACIPMNGERAIIDFLTSTSAIYNVLGDKVKDLALAKLDTMDFKSDLHFAKKVAKCWHVDVPGGIEEDAPSILEHSCQFVLSQKLSPVIIIHRFHEALDKLGEDIGSTLRNLEHSHQLKTVVTMPVSLTELRDRWALMDPTKAPFLASDWGQGHRFKTLKGYSVSEVVTLGSEKGMSELDSKLIFKATGGLVDLVSILLEQASGRKGDGLLRYVKTRSSELCERILDWLDPRGASYTYTKSLISLLDSKFYPSDIAFIKDHDWSSVLLDKNDGLGFDMLAWAAVAKMSRSHEFNLIEDLKRLYDNEDYDSASKMLGVLFNTDSSNAEFWSILHDLTIFCRSTSDVFNNVGQWHHAHRKLNKILAKISNRIPYGSLTSTLLMWLPICELLNAYFLAKAATASPDFRLEKFVCDKNDENLIVPYLQLLQLRFDNTRHLEAFTSLQGIITGPESLLQVYAFFRFGIRFWNFEGLSPTLADKLENIAGKPYKINSRQILGYSDLAHLIAMYEDSLDASVRLITDSGYLQKMLLAYDIRKENAHSISFSDEQSRNEYRTLFEDMLHRYSKIIDKSEMIRLPSPKKCIFELVQFSPKNCLSE